MPYRSTDKTRQKKDNKRTAMMQAAVQVFAEKGYYEATVRDIVAAADVAVGTFYFYFPDKETLFVHLYEETADFLVRTIRQAIANRATLPQQLAGGVQAYINIAVFEPAVVQLLLVGGVGAVLSLRQKRAEFREKLVRLWMNPLEDALQKGVVMPQDPRRTSEALTGAFDEVVLHLLNHPNPEVEAATAVKELVQFALRATAYKG